MSIPPHPCFIPPCLHLVPASTLTEEVETTECPSSVTVSEVGPPEGRCLGPGHVGGGCCLDPWRQGGFHTPGLLPADVHLGNGQPKVGSTHSENKQRPEGQPSEPPPRCPSLMPRQSGGAPPSPLAPRAALLGSISFLLFSKLVFVGKEVPLRPSLRFLVTCI